MRTLTLVVLSLALAACGDDDGTTNDNQNANQNDNQNQTGPVCGDAVTNGNEECDLGAGNSDTAPDTCRSDCRNPRCGDGVENPGLGEACDQGVANSDTEPDACRSTCVEPACGDGVIDTGFDEVCDDGQANGDGPDVACRTDCTPRRCGDGIIDVVAGETCDDGGTANGDGCAADCTVEPFWVCDGQPSVCGCEDYHRGPGCATCAVMVVEGGAGPLDGMTWATASGSVDGAINTAAGLTPGCEVWVAEGTYRVYVYAITQSILLRSGVSVYGGFAGTELARDERDPDAHPAILHGGNSFGGTEHVMHVVRGADDARLDGFVITGGDSGVYNDGTSPTIANCTFLGSPDFMSMGIYNAASAQPHIVGCRFSGHRRSTAGAVGGAINNNASNPTIESCLFFDNEATQGGAIANVSSSPLIVSCTFADNRATGASPSHGGAIYNSNASPTIYDSVFWDNTPEGIYTNGGAVSRYCNVMQAVGEAGANDDVTGDPLFVDAANRDYRLSAGSPAIDTANCLLTDLAPPVDLVGQPWTDGDGNGSVLPDRGCFEYVP